MKNFFPLIILLIPQLVYSQYVPRTEAIETISIPCSGGTNNRSALAYNPIRKLYYSVNAGATTYPVETFNKNGEPLNSVNADFDYRGAWWNPNLNTLEGNGRNMTGVWRQNLNISTGVALSGGSLLMDGTANIGQLVGDLDAKNNLIVYYSGEHIVRFNRADNTLSDSLEILGLPDPDHINGTAIVYTGVEGFEYGVFNYKSKELYYINAYTGVYSGRTQLPVTAAAPVNYRISFANGRFWVFDDDRQWLGFDVFEDFIGLEQKSPVATGVEGIRLATDGGTNNRSGLAFNPERKVYYSVNAGTTTRPIETFNESGMPIQSEAAGLDYRGIWWNPYSRSLEGNLWSNHGIFRHTLDADGNAITGGYRIKSSSVNLGQLCGDYDYVNNIFVFYENGNISFYSAVNKEHLLTVEIPDLDTEDYNGTSVVFTGVKGYEYGIYNFENRELVYIDAKTMNISGSTKLPDEAPQVDMVGLAYTNNLLWLFDGDNREWISYKVFCGPSLEPNVELLIPEDIVRLCTDDAPFLMSGGSPAGGIYSGEGISGDVFSPSVAGEGSHIISYTFTDDNNCSATAEQEIQIEICTGVDVPEHMEFKVYPNPSSGEVHIHSLKPVSIKVYDNKGEMVRYSENVNELLLNLPTGLYFIYAYSDSKVTVEKVIVN